MRNEFTDFTKKISAGIFFALSFISIAFGAIYLTRSEILSYHETFLEITHNNLPSKIATLFLLSMKIIGGLLIANAITTLVIIKRDFLTDKRVTAMLGLSWVIALTPVLIATIVTSAPTLWLVSALLFMTAIATALRYL